jgi:acetyl-CoA carboxylase carboxyl transferase subunit alpha
MIIAQQKGRDTKENLVRNFGMPLPEGYRKALRLMKMAEKFNMPIISLIDTKAAYAGIGSEERHVAEAIAVNLREMSRLKVPFISVVIGEGSSGGALGIGVTDRILILQYAYYSICPPEACAAILWRNRDQSVKAAESLKLNAKELIKLGIADEIIEEPYGGAHCDHQAAAEILRTVIARHLKELKNKSTDKLIEERYQKYRAIGVFAESISVKKTQRKEA